MKKYCVFGISCLALLITSAAMAKERVGDPYTLNYCPVSGKELGSMGDTPVYVDDDGREVRFCCAGCEKKYIADAEAMNKKIDEKLIVDQESHYSAQTCIKSGGPLDKHGKPNGVSFILGNRLMKTCCEKCEVTVKADPATYLAKLDKLVIEAQSANYKLGACPVSGEALGDSPVEMVVANRLIKLCCEGCKKKAAKDPLAVLEKVDTAK